MTEPTIGDVLRRLDAVDRDLVSIDRRFNAIESQLDLMATLQSEFRKETFARLDVLLEAVADIGANLTKHIEEGTHD